VNIDGIKNGIVIDHIPAGESMALYHALNLDQLSCSVAMIINATSQKMGRKDIIKIDEKININLDVLGYMAPDSTVNIIRNGIRMEKRQPDLPETVTDVIRCKNPRCITMTEQELPHIFRLTDRENRVYRCIYCETKAVSNQNG